MSEFWLAARDPELRDEAFAAGLAVLAKGRAAWAPLVLWRPASKRARVAIVRASEHAHRSEWASVARALGHVGGRAAATICIFGDEPSAMEAAFAIFLNVLELAAQGRVTNAKHAEHRAAQFLRRYCDGTYEVEPPFEDWEVELPVDRE